VILDVQDIQAHAQLASALGAALPPDEDVAANPASMVRLTYRNKGHRGPKEGSWYDIDPIAFESARYQRVDPDADGASFLRANLTNIRDGFDFAQFLTRPRLANASSSNAALVVNPKPKGKVELTVVDCGHGNWNEITTRTDRIIYDVGASRWFNKAQVRAVVDGRKLLDETRPITVIISHWDVDHYHALLTFKPTELAKLRVVFVPSQVPDTETYRRVRKHLNQHRVAMVTLPPAARKDDSREIVLHPIWREGIFTVFRATPGRSRNQTGIVLGVNGKNAVGLLTGDHHYDKTLAAVQQVACYGQRPCVLITPHHGGEAGYPSTWGWGNTFSGMTTPISCGPNSYGHPLTKVERELTAMQGGNPPVPTARNGTWTTSL